MGVGESEADAQHQSWSPATVALSCFLFVVAGILEVGGGWLVWQALREVLYKTTMYKKNNKRRKKKKFSMCAVSGFIIGGGEKK